MAITTTHIRPPSFISERPAHKNVTTAQFNLPRSSAPPHPAAPPPLDMAPLEAASAPTPPSSPSPSAPVMPMDDTRLSAAIEHLKQYAGRLAEQARSDALEIGFQVARKILETELTTSPAPLFGLIRTAVQRLGETRKLTISVCPEDLARIEAEGGSGALGLMVAQIELLPDSTLAAGDCVVDSEMGRVDGRLSTRLAELQRAITEEAA